MDFGSTDGEILYLITEYVKGTTLMKMIRRTPLLPLDRVFIIFNQVLAAVEEAHSARVIHRDLKPENIIYQSGSDPWLAKSPWYPVRKIIGDILGCGPTPSDKNLLLDAVRKSQLDEAIDFNGISQLFGFGPYETLSPVQKISSPMSRTMIKALGLGVANTSGICLLIEDVQEYDRASIAFFQSLVEDNNPGNVRIVSTSEVGLFPSREQYKYRLSPLDAQGVETLIHRHIRNDALRTPQLKDEILSTSRGNPLHAIQSLRCVDEGGEVHKELENIVEKRLARLTPEARQVFEAICALGRSVSTNLLNEFLCDDSLFLALEWLLLAGWISIDFSRNDSKSSSDENSASRGGSAAYAWASSMPCLRAMLNKRSRSETESFDIKGMRSSALNSVDMVED